MNPRTDIRRELLAMARRDRETRQRLLAEGKLFDGYHPEMERVHLENAERLAEIVDAHGWPGRSTAGDDGRDAAWLVAVHAISRPDLQRRWLPLLQDAAARGEVPRRQPAALGDRIRFHEGRPQRFGMVFDWDERGELTAGAIEDPERVDERRRRIGLEPLREALAAARRETSAAGEAPPRDLAERQRRQRQWERRVGWR